ncbi:bromodomain and WD repeat-containing [Brachionus plicatilis]|uniref:Bromodomain and WD repeat-containing n=1 Tax=Brachionus plicatilis TaxID=10195 RepID=A0A3M7SE24_BRAPC|nr:bromodomain and WD repeat-containing [Brachionus plicatilis]
MIKFNLIIYRQLVSTQKRLYILRQHYENSLQKKWQPMDSFRSYIDDSWYYGTIEAHKPFHDQYPHSEFQCFSIVWDSGDQDALSPWDLDEVGARGDGDEDASACVLYEPSAHEWHGLDRDSQCDRILSGIEIIRELSIAEPFNLPVDLIAFPHYAMVIGYPIDLNTIRERVANRYYRRVDAIEWDIRKIEEDAHEFNEPDSIICKQATLLTQVLVEFVMDADCTNPRPIYKRLCSHIAIS